MIFNTSINEKIDGKLLSNYFDRLVNQFFKLLPIREEEADTFATYSRSLQMEIIGCKKFIIFLNNDATILTLISILEYFASTPDVSVKEVKREVFKAIGLCQKLKKTYIEDVKR